MIIFFSITHVPGPQWIQGWTCVSAVLPDWGVWLDDCKNIPILECYNDVVQDCGKLVGNTLELPQSCVDPLFDYMMSPFCEIGLRWVSQSPIDGELILV